MRLFAGLWALRGLMYEYSDAALRVDHIIPVAEETGLISRLGEIVFEKTCRFIKDCQPEQYGLKYIEVNLSVVQCEDKLLAKKVY